MGVVGPSEEPELPDFSHLGAKKPSTIADLLPVKNDFPATLLSPSTCRRNGT
jgi:hypothetical protein